MRPCVSSKKQDTCFQLDCLSEIKFEVVIVICTMWDNSVSVSMINIHLDYANMQKFIYVLPNQLNCAAQKPFEWIINPKSLKGQCTQTHKCSFGGLVGLFFCVRVWIAPLK